MYSANTVLHCCTAGCIGTVYCVFYAVIIHSTKNNYILYDVPSRYTSAKFRHLTLSQYNMFENKRLINYYSTGIVQVILFC